MLDHQKCQDPRDKMFGVVGFSDEFLPADFVDYKQPIDAILENFTRCLIQEAGDLEAITNLTGGVLVRSPSWVPLWHREVDLGTLTYVDALCASQERLWKLPAREIEGQLAVAGQVISRVCMSTSSRRKVTILVIPCGDRIEKLKFTQEMQTDLERAPRRWEQV